MEARNTGAITLSHTGNDQGDYFFMLLVTGARVARPAWTVVPMPQIVVDTVEAMTLAERMPLIAGDNFLFKIEPNIPLEDDNINYALEDHIIDDVFEHVVAGYEVAGDNDAGDDDPGDEDAGDELSVGNGEPIAEELPILPVIVEDDEV